MDRNKIEQMWKIMKENNFQINNDINSKYLCTICNKILIEACNAPCGCRYCKHCIREYLNEERKVCPGTAEYCKNEVIDFDRDIQIDQSMNIKISKLEVKCPNISCQSKVELKMMEDHLRICENRFIRCPYFNVGCAIDKLVSDKADEHLLSEIHTHTKLLMEWIINSQNDSESLKKEMKQLMKDNKEMKEKIRLNEETIQNQRVDVEKLKSENKEIKVKLERSEKTEKENSTEIYKLGEEMSALKNDNRYWKEELRVIKNEITENIPISELRIKMEKQNKEIDKLNDEMNDMRYENELLKGEMQEMRNKEISQLQFNTKMEEQIKEIDQLKQKCKDIEMKLDEISRANEAIKSGSEKSMEIMREIVDQSKYGEFIWKMENWAEKRTQAQNGIEKIIYSRDFFTHKNGYKMRLCLNPDGFGNAKRTHLSLFFCIRRGPFDDILQWPFSHDVELSLMDQQSGVAHLTRTVKYSDKPDYSKYFMKPISEENDGFGIYQFMKLSELLTKPALTLGNQIFIRCKLSKPT